MKGLKTKLMSAVAMLTVSAVMLVGTSFAWYTLSTNPEVKNIKATAVANENLEIALVTSDSQLATNVDELSSVANTGAQGSKTDDYYTWGNLAQYTVSTNPELRPATYIAANGKVQMNGATTAPVTASGLYIPTYGDDGRISGLDTTALVDTAMNLGASNVNSPSYTTVVKGSTEYAARYDLWMRSNVGGEVTLSAAAKRDAVNDTDTTGAGSYIQSNAFKTGGVYASSADAVKVVLKVTTYGANGSATGTVRWVEAKNDFDTAAATNGKVNLSISTTDGNLFDATANTIYKVQAYVYLNGKVVTNAMAGADIEDLTVNLQFANANVDEAMQK